MPGTRTKVYSVTSWMNRHSAKLHLHAKLMYVRSLIKVNKVCHRRSPLPRKILQCSQKVSWHPERGKFQYISPVPRTGSVNQGPQKIRVVFMCTFLEKSVDPLESPELLKPLELGPMKGVIPTPDIAKFFIRHPTSRGPVKGGPSSGVDSKFSAMSDVDLEKRLSVSGWSGVSSVGLTIVSVGVDRHWFWFQCQCRMEKMGQCRVSETPPSWALSRHLTLKIHPHTRHPPSKKTEKFTLLFWYENNLTVLHENLSST